MDGWWVWAENRIAVFYAVPYAEEAARKHARNYAFPLGTTFYATSGEAPLEFNLSLEHHAREETHTP